MQLNLDNIKQMRRRRVRGQHSKSAPLQLPPSRIRTPRPD